MIPKEVSITPIKSMFSTIKSIGIPPVLNMTNGASSWLSTAIEGFNRMTSKRGGNYLCEVPNYRIGLYQIRGFINTDFMSIL